MNTNVESFKAYESEGHYVFHGSLNGDIAEFEPRQALSFQKPDGEPAIFAAEKLDPAIFMAVLGSRRVAGWDSDRFIPPYGFFIAESHWETAEREDWHGYVYALPRDNFGGNGWVWRAFEPVKPLDKCQVNFADLPNTITILSDEEEAAYVARYT